MIILQIYVKTEYYLKIVLRSQAQLLGDEGGMLGFWLFFSH